MDPTPDRPLDQTADPTTDPTEGPLTVTVADAAKMLGLTTEAVRMRVKRGTLASTRIAGTVYVVLERPNSQPNTRPNGGPNAQPNVQPSDRTEVVARLEDHNTTLREQVEHLRQELGVRNEELRRKDHLLAAALERIPELEPAKDTSSETRESPVTASEEPERVEDRGEEESRSWWKRLFSG